MCVSRRPLLLAIEIDLVCFYQVISLWYLLRHSSILCLSGLGQDVRVEETSVVKALRTHAGDVLEVRMIVSESSNSWHSKGRGIYEVRRKDWEDMLQAPSRQYTRDQWEKQTVYMVLCYSLVFLGVVLIVLL